QLFEVPCVASGARLDDGDFGTRGFRRSEVFDEVHGACGNKVRGECGRKVTLRVDVDLDEITLLPTVRVSQMTQLIGDACGPGLDSDFGICDAADVLESLGKREDVYGFPLYQAKLQVAVGAHGYGVAFGEIT